MGVGWGEGYVSDKLERAFIYVCRKTGSGELKEEEIPIDVPHFLHFEFERF